MNKKELRIKYRRIRKQLTQRIFTHELSTAGYLLSFANLTEEVDMHHFNLSTRKLALPRVEGKTLAAYAVTHMDNCVRSTFGILEPHPDKCRMLDPDEITLALVPGLAFDEKSNRLGFGGGYYDRFLKTLSCECIGVGYKEQISEELLPVEPHDVPMGRLLIT